MTARRLLVLDSYDASIVRQITGDGRDWDVLLLGIDERWFRRLSPELVPADDRVRYLDLTSVAAQAHEQVREFVLGTVAMLGHQPVDGVPLWQALASAGSSWWYLETTEKGPYRTPLVSQLYALALFAQVRERTRYTSHVVATRHSWLARAASSLDRCAVSRLGASLPAPPSQPRRDYLRHAATAAATVAVARLAAWRGRWPRIALPAGRTWVFSFLPAWWTRPLDPQLASERFFPAPPAGVAFVGWVHTPQLLWRSRRELAEVIAARQILVLNRLVPWRTVLGLLSPRRFFRFMRIVDGIRRLPELKFAGVDAGPVVARDLERSLTGGEVFQDQMLAEAMARFARQQQPRIVAYRAEFQPAEQAVLTGLRGLSRAVGFVHYPFGRRYLSMYESPATTSPGTPERLAPDAFISCGAVGREHLIDAGYQAERIALCGPQRHPNLVTRLRQPIDRTATRGALGLDPGTPVMLVAIAIEQADTEALFGALLDALDAFGPWRIWIRTHPNRPGGDSALKYALASLGPERAVLVPDAVSLYDTLIASDVLVTIGSTLAFEALALGCQAIAFETPATYAATSLAEFSDAIHVVHDAAELQRALDEIIGRAPAALARQACWHRTVTRMLGDLSTPLPRQFDHAMAGLGLAPMPEGES